MNHKDTMHVPVLLQEIIELLMVQPSGRYIDCTVGTGGHAEAILQRCLPHGRLLGIDADPAAIEVAKARLQPYGEAAILVNDNFENLQAICATHGFGAVHGILFDLGMSSLQLQDRQRGFSFQLDAPLDMRRSPAQALTASEIVNTFPEAEIAALLWEYGEERRSRLIARRIVENRPITTTLQLARLIEEAAGGARGRIHPATRAFQALRIVVNQELECLQQALGQTVELLAPRGRLAVISYHSLEDRLAKEFLQREAAGCICPPETPLCTCGHTPILKLSTRKAVKPSVAEVKSNPRSRSARLRVAERRGDPASNLARGIRGIS